MKDRRKVIQDTVGDGVVEFSLDPATYSVRIMRSPEHAQVISTFWFAWAGRFPKTELYVTSTPASFPDPRAAGRSLVISAHQAEKEPARAENGRCFIRLGHSARDGFDSLCSTNGSYQD